MELKEGRDKFIQAWGTLGSDWGINRTMAQIHALLLISPEAKSADEIMEELKISRGNSNMSLRSLMDGGLVYKTHIPGERKDFFVAEKDMWDIVRKIVSQRKKRELEPLLKAISEVSDVQGNSSEAKEFKNIIKDIQMFSSKADKTLGRLINSDFNWFVETFLKMMK